MSDFFSHTFFLLTNQPWVGGSHDPLLWFDNLLEQLTELRSLYLLLATYYKGHNSGMARWKPHMGQGMGGGVWCLLFACCSPGTPLSSPTGKLSEPHCEGVFMEVPSGWPNWLNPWPLMTKLIQSLSRPLGWEDRGWCRKFQTSNHRLAPSSNQPPSSKSHCVSIPETTLHHFKGLRGSCGRNQGLRLNILTKDAPVTLSLRKL